MKTPKLDRPVLVRFYMPTSLVAQMNFLLFSEVEGKVPFGAQTNFITACVRKELEGMPLEQLKEVYAERLKAAEAVTMQQNAEKSDAPTDA